MKPSVTADELVADVRECLAPSVVDDEAIRAALLDGCARRVDLLDRSREWRDAIVHHALGQLTIAKPPTLPQEAPNA